MEILLWLVPPAVVTVAAMGWVSWAGRERRGEVDRDVAVQRLAAALEREPRGGVVPRPPKPARDAREDRSTGVAVRPSRRAS
ncbi:hypothetical protein [Nocardioides sp. SYSU DS0663]|uniref:hypothetical protein n=1 Tax=Nocardioides sp. SYSU DS0663 TaxID=3416445 RepID=UPI003F4C02E6